jgi:hypothetical protein
VKPGDIAPVGVATTPAAISTISAVSRFTVSVSAPGCAEDAARSSQASASVYARRAQASSLASSACRYASST